MTRELPYRASRAAHLWAALLCYTAGMDYARLDLLERESRDKNFCRGQVTYALKKGTLKKEPCYCGETKVEAHHADYKRPLDVVWVCTKHHVELDKMRREQHVLD